MYKITNEMDGKFEYTVQNIQKASVQNYGTLSRLMVKTISK